MEITEVRIKLMEDSDDRLRAFCSITLDDCFVIRDLKIIEGTNGPFVAMPSRKLTFHCPQCGYKNHLRAQHCNQCGGRMKEDRTQRDHDGRAKLYADIAHPINSECREMLQSRVISEFEKEKERATQPGYVSRYDDDYDDTDVSGIPDPQPKSTNSQAPKTPEPEPKVTNRHIEPAEKEPRAPHKVRAETPTSSATTTSTPYPEQSNDDGFGAGIF